MNAIVGFALRQRLLIVVMLVMMLGVGVVYAHKAGAMRFSESRWFKMLPMVSAALLLGIGLWLCREGLQAVK